MCSGPGFIGYTLLKKKNVNKLVLSDINIDLYPSIQETNEFNKLQNVEFILSDCFDILQYPYEFIEL